MRRRHGGNRTNSIGFPASIKILLYSSFTSSNCGRNAASSSGAKRARRRLRLLCPLFCNFLYKIGVPARDASTIALPQKAVSGSQSSRCVAALEIQQRTARC
jgi:hypothetical protein